MLTEILYDLIIFIHWNMKTTLPHKWVLCKLHLSGNLRLIINDGSYFIVYVAFTYWFMQYTLRHLKTTSDSHLQWKDRLFACVISFCAATQFFWPLFLLTIYFFTCSFYPWFTALAVLFLNFPSALTVLQSRENALQLGSTDAQSAVIRGSEVRAELYIPSLRHQTDARIFDRQRGHISEALIQNIASTRPTRSSEPRMYRVEAFLLLDSEESSLLEQEITSQSSPSYYPISPPEAHYPYDRPPDRTQSLQFISTSAEQPSSRQQEIASASSTAHYMSSPPVMQSSYERPSDRSQFQSSLSTRSGQLPSPEPDIASSSVSSYNSFSPPSSVTEDEVHPASTHIDIGGTSTDREEMAVAESTTESGFFGRWRRTLGYCGHCGLYDYLPFRQDFTRLREPYHTRSGYVYGPIRRLLRMAEFLRLYNIR